ncbi:MAG: YlxR family protein [Coriobacteriales bacterium]
MAEKRQRTCVGCGSTRRKQDLVRIVRAPDGSVSVDAGGRAPGRGAYLCRDRACLEAARRGRGLERALRVGIDEGAWMRLGQEFDMLCARHSDVQ